MFLPNGSYKFIFADADGVTIRTQDNIIAVSSWDANVDIPGIAGELLDALDAVYLADGSGGTTAGRWYKADATTAAQSSTAVLVAVVVDDVAAAGGSGTFRLQGRIAGFVGLTPGAEYYVSTTPGLLTDTAPTNHCFIGVADLSTSLVVQTANAESRAIITGGIAISGQLAQDLIIAASPTQLDTLALTALQGVRKNAANNALEGYDALGFSTFVSAERPLVSSTTKSDIKSIALTANQTIRKNAANTAVEACDYLGFSTFVSAERVMVSDSQHDLKAIELIALQGVRKDVTNAAVEAYDTLGFSTFVSAEAVMVSTTSKNDLKAVTLTALQSVRKNAANDAIEAFVVPIDVYTATLADVANTTDETTILSFTIPANSMADGDVIRIYVIALEKNNSGGAATFTAKLNAGAGAQIEIGTEATANNAAEFAAVHQLELMRRGSSLDALPQSSIVYQTWNRYAGYSAVPVGSSTPTNFTSDFVVSIKVTLSAAHALLYLKPQAAKVIHFKS